MVATTIIHVLTITIEVKNKVEMRVTYDSNNLVNSVAFEIK